MNSVLGEFQLSAGPPLLMSPEGVGDVMQQCVGGPLAMVSPLHSPLTFDTRQMLDSRVPSSEDQSVVDSLAVVSSHSGVSPPPSSITHNPPHHDPDPTLLLDRQPSFSDPSDQALFEADKRQIYKHPLFPLLALLFEKCELATQSAECPSSEGFNVDIQAFVQHQQQDKRPLLSDSEEANELMIRAIQVLRIHLLELEKVQELCKDFCNRYITCLKGKMQSENLLRSDYGGYESDDSGPGRSSSSQPYLPQNGL